jgi:hypothetical protein
MACPCIWTPPLQLVQWWNTDEAELLNEDGEVDVNIATSDTCEDTICVVAGIPFGHLESAHAYDVL